MKPLISDNLIESIVNQIGEEKKNANIYLGIASYLNGKGLSNLAKKFEEQHAEETEHSFILYKLLSDLSVIFIVPETESYNLALIENIGDIANLYLEREIETTDSLGEIKNQAMDEGNHVVEERLREMIKLQQQEYAEATDFYDKSLLFNEWWKAAIWDSSIGG